MVDEIKKEKVQILVTVEIEYEKDNKDSRKSAIETAKENCTGIATYGYPVSTKSLSAKEFKKRKKKVKND